MSERKKIQVENLIRHLNSLPMAKQGNGGLQLKTRCPFCGDSKKSATHTNFSIKINFNDLQPLFYQCFRADCKETGLVDGEFLRLTGCTNPHAFMELANYNKVAKVKTKNKYEISKVHSVEVIAPVSNTINKKKYSYFCSRIGSKLNLDELKKLKVIIDPIDFIKFNSVNMEKYPEGLRKYYLNSMRNGIGFLSIDNSTLVIRRIDRKEYVIINLFPDDEGNKTYVIPSKFDLFYQGKTVINIAEGAFDIISVFKNIDKSENSINIAASGGINSSTLKYFIKKYGLIDELEINIYGDNDVSKETYKKAISGIRDYVRKLNANLYYNEMPNEKDFGVPKDRIKSKKHIIL